MIIVWTGHTPADLGGYAAHEQHDKVKRAMRTKVIELVAPLEPRAAIEEMVSGMALGVDQWGFEIGLEFHIPVVACVPFRGQEKVWPPKAQLRYHELLKLATEVVYVSPPPYSLEKMQLRNCAMVDRLTARPGKLAAVWNGSPGGTANTVGYALKKGLKDRIVTIDPRTL